MEKSELIFLLGKSKSGKDTVGEIFSKYGYKRVAFGDKVKEEISNQYKVSLDVLHTQGLEKETWRPIIIEWAEAKRNIDQNYWIDKAFKPYLDEEGFFKQGLKLVMTDVRRSSEILWILEQKKIISELNALFENQKHYLSVKLIYLERPGNVDLDPLTNYAIGLADGLNYTYNRFIDQKLINDKDIVSLERKISYFLSKEL